MLLYTLCFANLIAQAQLPAQGAALVQLDYVRAREAAHCPDTQQMQQSVQTRLGYSPFAGKAERCLVVRIEEERGGLVATVVLRGKNGAVLGRRTLKEKGTDCLELAEALELAIAIAVDPMSLYRTPAAASPSSELQSPFQHSAMVSTPRVDRSAAPAMEQSEPIQASASVGGVLSLGSSPGITGGVVGAGAVAWRFLSLGVEGRLDSPGYGYMDGGSVSTTLLAASVVPCARIAYFKGCGLAMAGALRAAGHGLLGSRSFTIPYFALGGRAAAEVPLLGPTSLQPYVDILFPLTLVTLGDSRKNVFWSAPPASLALGAAFSTRF